MIEKLKNILGADYEIKEEQVVMVVYHKTNYEVNQETYIKINREETGWTLYEVQRGESFEICKFINYDAAICGLYILSKKIFEHPKGNSTIKNELRQCMESDLNKVMKNIEKEFDENLFSLNNLKRGAILLESMNGIYDISYCGLDDKKISIVKGRKFTNAVVVFYNYILLLFEFDKLIKIITSIIQLNEDVKENLKLCYLGK